MFFFVSFMCMKYGARRSLFVILVALLYFIVSVCVGVFAIWSSYISAISALARKALGTTFYEYKWDVSIYVYSNNMSIEQQPSEHWTMMQDENGKSKNRFMSIERSTRKNVCTIAIAIVL